jgi:hypothetical protein
VVEHFHVLQHGRCSFGLALMSVIMPFAAHTVPAAVPLLLLRSDELARAPHLCRLKRRLVTLHCWSNLD